MLAVSNVVDTVANYLGELNNSFKGNKVKKRNGQVVPFDLLKIYNAIDKCFGKADCSHAVANVAYGVSHALFHSDAYTPDYVFTVEEVQDAVETELMRSHPKMARKYIIYREQRAKAREDKKAFDVTKIMRTYLDQEDWRVKENSNSGYSIGGLIHHNASTMVAHYWLNNIYSKEFKDAHVSAALHCHDIGFLGAYCLGHSLGQLIEEGLHGINGNLSSKPAKHMQALMQQAVNYLGILQCESAGAQAFGSVDTYIAPFIAYDKLTQKEVKQNVQSLLFGLNIPSRWSGQSIFSNFTLDLKTNAVLKDRPVIIGGKWWKKPQDDMISVGGAYVDSALVEINSECYDPAKFYTYGDFQKEIDMFNTAFFELMYDGDMQGRIFSYPIPTINITKDFDWDSPVAKLLWKLTGKYGTPYFSNFVNSDMKPEDSFSMCCRLRLDKRELNRRGGGLFGASERTGSIGVVTINLPRIAYLVRKELGADKLISEYTEAYKTRLNTLLVLAKDSLEIKRKTVTQLTEQGLFPYIKRYIKTWNNHFSTIGILGMNEACLNLLGKNIADPEARAFALDVGNYIRNRISDFQDETGNLYNYEATPGESTSYRFAKNDKKQFPDIITAGDPDGEVYYTNSTNLPVGHTDDIFDALDHQDDFMVQYTGGCVFHAMLGESIDDPDVVKKLVKSIAEHYRLPYFSITPTFSVCKKHGYLKGKQPKCPTCCEETEVYSRIVGYYRPVSNWHKGKKQEFKDRVTYAVPNLAEAEAS